MEKFNGMSAPPGRTSLSLGIRQAAQGAERYAEAYARYVARDLEYGFENGESLRHFAERVSAGVDWLVRHHGGQTVAAGQVLADVHARDEESAARAVDAVAAAYEIGDEAPLPHGILLDVIA